MVLLLCWPVLAAGEENASLESITFHRDAVKGETVSFKMNGKHLPTIAMIKGENPRIVLDYSDTRCSSAANRSFTTNGKLAKKVRVGIHNDANQKTRVVVDLAPRGDYQYSQSFNAEDNTLNLTIVSTRPVAEQEKKDAEPVRSGTPASAGPQANEKPSAKAKACKKPAPGKAEQKKQETATAPLTADQQQTSARPEAQEKENLAEAAQPPVERQTAATPPPNPAPQGQAEAAVPVRQTPAAAPLPAADSSPAPARSSEPAAAAIPPPPAPADIKAKAANEEEKTSAGYAEKKAAAKKQPPTLTAVKFDKNFNKGEIVIFKLNGFFPPKVTGSEKGEPKVFCDFTGISLSSDVKELIRCNGRFVTSIHVTEQKKSKTVRAVLTLTPNKNYDLQQVFYKEDNLFVLIVNSHDGEKPSEGQ